MRGLNTKLAPHNTDLPLSMCAQRRQRISSLKLQVYVYWCARAAVCVEPRDSEHAPCTCTHNQLASVCACRTGGTYEIPQRGGRSYTMYVSVSPQTGLVYISVSPVHRDKYLSPAICPAWIATHVAPNMKNNLKGLHSDIDVLCTHETKYLSPAIYPLLDRRARFLKPRN